MLSGWSVQVTFTVLVIVWLRSVLSGRLQVYGTGVSLGPDDVAGGSVVGAFSEQLDPGAPCRLSTTFPTLTGAVAGLLMSIVPFTTTWLFVGVWCTVTV